MTALTAGTLSACAAAPVAEPITLQIATDDVADTPAGRDILYFADEVERVSEGNIVIEPAWHAAGDSDEWDQANARLVVSGDIELGFIPARAWDVEGVTTLAPLHAPFLVSTEDALNALVTDDGIVSGLLDGLGEVGVVGIDLVPEGLRHPVGYGAPLLSVDDYAGQVIRTPRSDTSEAIFEALGATTTTSEFDDQRGTEVSFALANDGILTANVVFFPKVHTLVANAEVWDDLSTEQQGVLREAAAATKSWVIETWPSEEEAAVSFCEAGGELVTATEEQFAGLKVAVEPVVAELRVDAAGAELLKAIEDVVAGTDAAKSVPSCDVDTDGLSADALNGTYTVTVDEDALAALGVTDETVLAEYPGDRTITLDDGDYTIGYANGGPDWSGTYDVVGDEFIWHWTKAAEDWSRSTFDINADGSVSFSNWDDGGGPQWVLGDRLLFSTWTKTS